MSPAIRRREERRRRRRAIADLGPVSCHIPMDVIAEILSRLPIRSIGRFMLVCKDWLGLIRSHRFSVMRAKNTPFSTLYYCVSSSDPSSIHQGKMIEFFKNYYSVFASLTPRAPKSGSSIGAVGSYNGLLCLLERGHRSETFSILNPITNEKTLATTIWDLDPGDYKIDIGYYGFGYSPSTDEYKVLKCFKMVRNEIEFRYDYQIFTFGVDKRWRKLSPHLFPETEVMDSYMVPCNGAFHWLVGASVFSFDIAQENTRRIPIPRIDPKMYLRLSVSKNRLGLFLRYYFWESDQVEFVWEMEECGNSWRRLSMLPDRLAVPGSRRIAPLSCTTKHGGGVILQIAPIGIYCSAWLDEIGFSDDVRPLFEFTPSFSSINDIMLGNRWMEQLIDP